MTTYVLALDQGTTASRSLIFDANSNLVSSSKKEFTQYFPQPGMVEHDANEIWETQLFTLQDTLEQAKLKLADMACIGITNQRETILLWDKTTGEPLHNAIVWQDKRTTDLMGHLQKSKDIITSKSGLVADPYFSAPKLKWLLDNVPGARDSAAKGNIAAGTMDSWLIYRLSGGKSFITDITNACRTMLFNIHSCEWDDELLDIFEIPKQILPEVVTSSIPLDRAPVTDEQTFGAAIPITGIAGDQHAALLGQSCTEPGMIKNTYGTGCFMLMNTGDTPIPSKNNLLTTIAWQLPDSKPQYALEGSIFVGGSVIQWLRDGLGIIKSAAEINAIAAEDNGGVYFVPAFVGLGSPHWDAKARGTIIGITRGTTKGHIARAALESIAFQSVELAEAMRGDMAELAGVESNELRADGGVTASDLFMQIQADLLGTEVKKAHIEETTALGAAYFAGLSIGIWKDLDEINATWRAGASYKPKLGEEEKGKLLARWKEALNRSKEWI
ncbi:MAG: glycerol kinase GlpK [Candidatus Portiera sp.]|nr:glycerol kinase GlpK [Portiera sp.]